MNELICLWIDSFALLVVDDDTSVTPLLLPISFLFAIFEIFFTLNYYVLLE